MQKRLLEGCLSKPIQQSILKFSGLATMTERSSPPGVNRSRRFQIYLCKTNGDGHKEKKIN